MLRSDGSPERDFLYVEDAAGAYLAIADALDRDEVRGEAFNAGGGRPYRGRRGGRADRPARRAPGSSRTFAVTGNPAGEIDRQYVDPSKIRDLVGWEPRVGLEEGLRATIEWYREHEDARAPEPDE